MVMVIKMQYKITSYSEDETIELAQNIGTSRYTIGSIINGRTDGLSKQTINKIDAYLAKCQ